MKSLREPFAKVQTKIQLDVLPKRPQPVALRLPRYAPASVPYAFTKPMPDPLEDYHDRCAVPRPTICWPDRIDAPAINTAPTLQIHQGLISVKPDPDITMPPYPVAPAAFLQTMPRPREKIPPTMFHYLLDTYH